MDKSTLSICLYSIREQILYMRWSRWIKNVCLFFCKEEIVLFFFRCAKSRLNSVEIYDFQSKTWSTGLPMLSNRFDLNVTCLGSPLYALGGIDGRAVLNTVERFDPETGEWTYVTSMITSRCTFGVTILDNR